MKAVVYFFILGAILLPVCSYAAIEYDYSPENNTDVSGDRRAEPFTAAMVSVGIVVASIWKSIQKETSLKIHIRNLLSNSELKIPQWYSLHGHASVLPPPVIKQGEDITEIQFDKTAGGIQGTEGALAYSIASSNGKSFLIIMWRVPQFGIYQDISFNCMIEKNTVVNEAYLENLNKDSKEKKSSLKKAEQHHEYYSIKDGIFTINAAMGTQSALTLKVIVSSL